LGVALALPALGDGRALDDYVLELIAKGRSDVVLAARGIDLFQFASGEAGQNRALMSRGSLLPWWSDPELRITFFRPLSSLLHRLDFWAWPTEPVLMYAHTLLWFGVLLALAARLYARLEPRPAVAAMAAVLYAVNDAHGPLVAWLSNRNAILSAVGAVAALLAHDRERRERRAGRPRRLLRSPLWLLLGLLAGELGLSAWALLIAYAVAFESGTLIRRLGSLAVHGALTVAWVGLHVASGAGVQSSGVYLHPLLDSSAFLAALPQRFAVLIGAAFGPLPADLVFLDPTGAGRAALVLAVLLLAALFWLARAQIQRDATSRFWWLAMALATLPIAASFPSDRLLVVLDLPAMAIVSRTLIGLWEQRRERRRSFLLLGVPLLLTHALLAPVAFPWRAQQMQRFARASQRAFACLETIPELEQQTLIVLGAPIDFFVSYLQVERAARGLPLPTNVLWFANPRAALDVRGTGQRGFSVEREGGFFTTPAEQLYRRGSSRLTLDDQVLLPGLVGRVSSLTAAGAPARLELTLDEPLLSGRYAVLVWRGEAYVRVGPDALQHLHVPPALPIVELLARWHD
jgi:hypothetical protein